MKFKIENENIITLRICLASMLIAVFLYMANNSRPDIAFCICAAVNVITGIMCLLDKFVGTSIIIDGREITIKYVFGKKVIYVEEIYDIRYERYIVEQKRRSVFPDEPRLRVFIELHSDETIILTDKAYIKDKNRKYIISRLKELPDEEVVLYRAYMAIKDLM